MSISEQELVNCGLPSSVAKRWVAKLGELASTQDEVARWQQIASELLAPDIPFPLHELLYDRNYGKHRQQQLPRPAWIPNARDIASTHLAEWIAELGFSNYEQLHAWSVSDHEEFLKRLTVSLSIQFTTEPTQYCDLSAGIEQIQWLRNAKLNIAESCFQADEDSIGIIAGDHANHLEHVSIGQLKAATARVANGLIEQGLKPGDRAAVSMPMTVDAIAIFLGIIAAGGAVVAIPDSLSTSEMAIRLEITQPKTMFIQEEIIRNGKVHPLYEKIHSQDNLPAIVLRSTGSHKVTLRSIDIAWEDFLSDDIALRFIPRSPADETTILFSSGTTGHPKAIPWDHATPIKAAGDAYFHHDIHPGDVLCWPTNLGWMMGPWLVYASLINKGTIAISQTVPTSTAFCDFVQQASVTMLGVVPSLVSAWRKQTPTAKLDWEAIKLFSSTGECSNPSDMHWLMSRANYRPVLEYCGGTEIGGGYATGTLIKPAVPGMFSAQAVGSSWLLLNESGEPSSIGEVFLQPPAIGLSTRLLKRNHREVYFADTPPGPQQRLLRRHGDQMEQLPGGYYRSQGRIDDAMNLGGIKVSSVQIEDVLLKHHNVVRELAAVSVPPTGGGPEQLVIYAVLDAELNLEALRAEMQQSIKEFLCPLFKIYAVETIDRLPKTASNKVMRRELREMFLAARAATS